MVEGMSSGVPEVSLALVLSLFVAAACSVQAGASRAARGPRLTDAQLFAALDLTREGLEGVRKAVEAGDLAAAKKALAGYLRNRTSVPWYFDPHKIDRKARHSTHAADKTVAGRVRVIGVWHTFPNGDFDWFYSPTIARKDLAVNYEWQWQLGRMGFWRNLGRAYWGTGDEKYAEAFAEQLRSWVRQCPRPTRGSGNVANSAWRTIECGIRMSGSWPDAYHRFLTSPSFTDDDIVLYLKLCVEHARHLRRHHRSGGNWLTMEMHGLYTVGAVFPELKKAREWRTYAARVLHKELDRQFLPDGAQAELTPGYHQVALTRCLGLHRLATVVGRADELPKDYVARAEKAFDFNLYLMTPDRDMPRFNDSWRVNVPRSLEPAATLFPERQDFRWVATRGRSGSPPAKTSYPFPYAGYYAMRSGWEKDANALFFDAGPLGIGHWHQDKLSVAVWAYGREVLFDGGGGQYERSKWRTYDLATFSHNTVLVDGQPQERRGRNRWAEPYVSTKPIDARWESTEAHDFAAGLYAEGYGSPKHRPVKHIRRVLFVKPDLFVVADTLVPKDNAAHTYQARWHLATPATTLDKASKAAVTTDKGKPNLAVVPLLTQGLDVRSASAQEKPELLGWKSHKTAGKPWAPATTVLHARKGKGEQRFLTLLVPLKPGDTNPVRSVRAKSATSAEVSLSDGRRLAIEVGADPEGGLALTETLANGTVGRKVGAGRAR